MNIFVTSKCPIECAAFLDNKRVIKMTLETAQLLATAINLNGGKATYKSTHKNHPSAIWVRESRANYKWTLEHFKALLSEYTRRYDKVHACERLIEEFETNIDLIPDGKLTKFANCAANASLGVSFKHMEDVTLAYQLYLNVRWDNDKKEPEWF